MFANKKLQLTVLLLVFIALVILGCSTNLPVQQEGLHSSVYNFRDYEWGTPMSVVLENEGEPNNILVTTDHLIQGNEHPTDYIYARDEKIEVYHLSYYIPTIPVAGYDCFMEIYFYNDALFHAYYVFSQSTIQKLPIYRDVLNKLTMLYGTPMLSNNGYTAEWNNIKLRYSRTSYNNDEYVFLYYDSYERIKMINEKRQKENEMITIQQNNTTGL